jgi:predicted nucleic acid-binding protein
LRTALDTNILSALLSNEATVGWIAEQLGEIRLYGPLTICGPVYSELMAHPRITGDYVTYYLNKISCRVDFEMDRTVWHKAGQAFAEYAGRRRQQAVGEARRLVTDFVIGAHAALKADRLMTLDPDFYRKNFPSLTLITHAP